MLIPETTSAEAFERYVGGKCLAVGHGEAWREIKAWIIALPPVVDEDERGGCDVALEVGYANPSYFARLFRRETGLSPSDYRRQR